MRAACETALQRALFIQFGESISKSQLKTCPDKMFCNYYVCCNLFSIKQLTPEKLSNQTVWPAVSILEVVQRLSSVES